MDALAYGCFEGSAFYKMQTFFTLCMHACTDLASILDTVLKFYSVSKRPQIRNSWCLFLMWMYPCKNNCKCVNPLQTNNLVFIDTKHIKEKQSNGNETRPTYIYRTDNSFF